ncbi:MAG: DUF4282 domain-containing protein [Acidimicrobiales bacterium]|jgi:hypothetical protein
MSLGQAPNMQKGFFGSLFDISFKSIITPRIIKVLYVLAMIFIALITIVYIVVAFNANAALGAVTLLILGPLYFFFSLIWTRVALEFIMAVFAIQENTGRIPPSGWGPPVGGTPGTWGPTAPPGYSPTS